MECVSRVSLRISRLTAFQSFPLPKIKPIQPRFFVLPIGHGAGDLRRLGLLAAAIDLYASDFLADIAVKWAVGQRNELGELFINTTCAYADELMGLTRYAETREVLSKALKIEPLRDDLHQRMLICLHKMGRDHEVVNHYLKYCDLCRTELGLPPSSDIQTWYSKLI